MPLPVLRLRLYRSRFVGFCGWLHCHDLHKGHSHSLMVGLLRTIGELRGLTQPEPNLHDSVCGDRDPRSAVPQRRLSRLSQQKLDWAVHGAFSHIPSQTRMLSTYVQSQLSIVSMQYTIRELQITHRTQGNVFCRDFRSATYITRLY